MRRLTIIFVVLLNVFLVACGGSGGGSGRGSDPGVASSSRSSVQSSTLPSSVSSSSSQVSSSVPSSSSAISSSSSESLASSSSSVSSSIQGEAVLPEDSLTAFSFWGGNYSSSSVGTHQIVNVDHPDFSRAVRVQVNNPAGAFWNGQVNFSLQEPLANNDVILIHLWFRKIESLDESGSAFATVFLEGAPSEYRKYAEREVSSTGEWQEYFLPVKIQNLLANDADKLTLRVGFGAGSKTQVFEVGGVQITNYRQNVTIEQLPKTEITYGGRDADASWRVAAAQRIETHRKGNFTLTIKNSTGDKLSALPLEVNFKRHHYHFGSVIVGSLIMGQNSNSQQYRSKVLELFNQSGPENDLKWAPWIGEWGNSFNQTQTLNALQWLKDNNFYVRGHVLVWPSRRNLPELVKPYIPADNPAAADPQVKDITLSHIDDITSKTSHLLDEWDVLNEPYDNHDLMDAFGDQVMVDWFNRARQNLPEHKLYINDYSILSAGGRDIAHQNHYKQTIQYLVDNNAAIDGIGFQSHFGASPTDIEKIYSILEEFHTLFPNLKFRSTEFDVNTDDQQMQADFTRDFLTIFFSHPSTVGVQKWGFWEGAHWLPKGAMYTTNWQEKPNAVAWKKLIYQDWWNNFTGTTTAEGEYSNRGFYGDYEVKVTYEGQAYTKVFSLLPNGDQEFELILNDE